MPSANPAGKVMMMSSDKEIFTEPMKPAVTIVEHKIRNLEKRKAKLDQYKSEQDQGKELNADQLAAVAKYTEVTQQLELAREFVKQFTQINEETRRQIKKEQKKEAAERLAVETERIRQLFLIQTVLIELRDERAVDDFIKREPGTVELSRANASDIQHLTPLLLSFLSNCSVDPDYFPIVTEAAEIAALILEGKPKKVNWHSNATYKELKDMLLSVAESDYLRAAGPLGSRTEMVLPVNPVPVQEELSESESSVPSIGHETINILTSNDFVPPVQAVPIPSTYSFLQESQIYIESPHMDPAVVAVSSFVPPPISQTSEVQKTAFTTSVIPEDSREIGGMGDATMHQVNSITIDDEINEWNGGPNKQGSNTFSTNDSKDESYEEGEGSNRFGSNLRGGFRGGRGNSRGRDRGAANGYPRGGPRLSSRGFANGGRIGYYRSDFPDKDFDNNKEKLGWPCIERPLSMQNVEERIKFYICQLSDENKYNEEMIPVEFPYVLPGFQFPEEIDPRKVVNVIEPYVSKACQNVKREVTERMRDCLRKSKMSRAFPDYEDIISYELTGVGRYYRFALIERTGKKPVLFLGMDFSQEKLYSSFWTAAVKVEKLLL